MNREIDLFTIASGIATVVVAGLSALVIDGRIDIPGGWLVAITVGLIGLALVFGGTTVQRRGKSVQETEESPAPHEDEDLT